MERMSDRYILALDQGTTSSRSLVFDATGRVVAMAPVSYTHLTLPTICSV